MSEEHFSNYEDRERHTRQYAQKSSGGARQAKREPSRPKKRKRRRHPIAAFFKFLGTLLLITLCTGGILCCFGVTYIKNVIVPIADLSLDDFELGENSVMYYTDSETGRNVELVTLLNTTSSIWVDYHDMPQNLIDAAVAIEDKRFWTHPGVDWRRTGRAVLSMFTGGSIEGGSTITQQLIKNLTDYNETTVKRKVTEIVRALRFTQNNSKKDTITWYLNIIPLGSGCEGVGSAAFEYFGKEVSELSLAECASLISITNNPSRYGPYSFARVANKDGEVWTARQWNKWRQENVLNQMLEQGMITQREHDEAVAEELQFVHSEDSKQTQEVYSWYEETVIADVKRDLKETYGLSDSRVAQLMSSGGLRIYSCLDPRIQAIAEEVYTNRENLNYTSASGKQMQSAITIIDNASGDVVAVVGRFGEKTQNLLHNFATDAKRQPGSSIKPLTVYSPAIEMGLVTPISVIDDYPYRVQGGKAWPLNSGSARYKGLTTVRQGLTDSTNTIAVRLLADYVTPQASFNFAVKNYKLNLLESRTDGNRVSSDIDISPLAMGGLTDGLSTREMAQAFATFPNNGVYTDSRTYTRVEDSNGNIILQKDPARETVIKDTTAYYMNEMLTNVVNAGTGTRAKLSGMTAAGKTGTTSDNFDRWFVGYTPYYTAAVWTGYEYNEKMSLNGGNPAAILWQKVMSPIHEGLENKKFPTPDGLVTVGYCMDSGLLASEYCKMDPRGSRVASGTVYKDDAPSGICNVHTAQNVVTICVDDPILDSDGNDSGLCHLAGDYCVELSLRELCLPDYDRPSVGGAVANDEKYRKDNIIAHGTCQVHAEPPVVEPEEPEPSTDPFDPLNPITPMPDGSENVNPWDDVPEDTSEGTTEPPETNELEPPTVDLTGAELMENLDAPPPSQDI